MSGHAYLTFFDAAPGESPAVGHEDWIDLLSWTWGVTASTGPGGPGAAGGGGGRPDPTALVWEHAFDAASTRLLGFVASGRHIPKAELHVTRAGGHGGRDAWLVVKMEDVDDHLGRHDGLGRGRRRADRRHGVPLGAVRYRRQRPDGSLGDARDLRVGHPPGHRDTAP